MHQGPTHHQGRPQSLGATNKHPPARRAASHCQGRPHCLGRTRDQPTTRAGPKAWGQPTSIPPPGGQHPTARAGLTFWDASGTNPPPGQIPPPGGNQRASPLPSGQAPPLGRDQGPFYPFTTLNGLTPFAPLLLVVKSGLIIYSPTAHTSQQLTSERYLLNRIYEQIRPCQFLKFEVG